MLIGLGLILIAATAYLFINLRDRQQAVLESVREDAMWAVFQTHRETSRLVEAILVGQKEGTPQAFETISLNFDLVYSRMTLLNSGFFSEKFRGSQHLGTAADALQRDIRVMAETVDAVAGDPDRLQQALPSLLKEAYALQKQSNDLVIATNERLGTARAENRTQTSVDYGRLARVVALTTLVFVGTIALQFIQLRLISRTQTQLRELSVRNSQSAKAAQAASEAKSMFLATMSHEIRTPLNGIIGAVDLLDETNLSPEQARRTLTIRRSGHILLDVINDILDFSNLDANGVTYQNAPVSLPNLSDVLADVFRQRLKDAGLSLEIEGPPLIVSTDDVRLRQVLLNLIGNAIKFTPAGTIRVRATIPAHNMLRIEVQDEGIGIPEEEQPKLFQNFSQIEGSASRRFGGSGLGLAISRRIVNGLGGTIGVHSVAGEGSTFWLEIPAEVLGEVTESNQPAAAQPTTGRTNYDSQILLVEDNAINREVAKALLESFGATVTTANDGQAAIDCLQKKAFDLVIMDLQMPVMDGITATLKLRELGFDVTVVGLTANAFAEDRQRCLDAGMNDFMAKPVSREKIATLLGMLPEKTNTAESATDNGLLDMDQLEPVLEDLGKDLFLELLDQLHDDGQTLLRDAQQALPDAGSEAIDKDLHSLKGAASTLGLTRVGAECQKLREARHVTRGVLEDLVHLLDQSIGCAKDRIAPG